MSVVRDLRAFVGLGVRALAARAGGTLPFKITLVLTDRCDCRCEACFIWRKKKGEEPSPEDVRRMLQAAPFLRWVNLTGGEMFLRDDVVDVVRAVRDALPGLAVLDFPTTGQRVDRILSDAERIGRLGIPRVLVTVSVEGPSELHDRLRGREGAFENAMATFAGLRRLPGIRPYLGMTLSDANADRVEETLAAVSARVPGVGWRDLHLNVFTQSEHYYENEEATLAAPARLAPVLAKALRAREAGADPTDRIEAAYLRLLPEYLATGRSPLPCRSLSASIFVAANGDVYPCTVYGRRLGNVRETPLPEILSAAEARSARAVIARDACPGCWSPCEANPTIVAGLPGSLLRRPRRRSSPA